MPKRKCVTTSNLKIKFPILRNDVLCTIRNPVFSIENGGQSGLNGM